MEPLFLAVKCGCHADLFREALHDVYIPRTQRGNSHFACNVLGARGALLSILGHFFKDGRLESPVEMGVGEHSLIAKDQLFVLMQAGLYLTAIRGLQSAEARICYHHQAEPLCHPLNRPLLLYCALTNERRYSLMTDKLTATMTIANDSLGNGFDRTVNASEFCLLAARGSRHRSSRGNKARREIRRALVVR
jgi:hypothetical protein